MAKRIDLRAPATARHLKALVYGKSGTGKTTFGASAPRPLILLSEGQAVPNIRAAAKLHGQEVEVLWMENLADYRNVVRALNGDKSKPFVVTDNVTGGVVLTMDPWPESIVVDSLTDAMTLVAEEIRRESPPRTGKDGLPVDSERFWNVFKDRGTKLIRAFRDAPVNVLFLCLLDDKELGKEGEEKVRWVGPQLSMRAFPSAVQAAVNVVGITNRTRSTKANPDNTFPMVYGIRTIGPSYMETKPFPPLRDAEVMDFSSWCMRVNGIDDGSLPPELDQDERAPMVPMIPENNTVATPAA